MHRRQFLKVGLAGACALAVAQRLSAWTVDSATPAGSLDLKALNNRDADLVAALASAILSGALPDEAGARAVAVAEVVEAFDRTVAGLSPPVQREVKQLLALLTFAPSRWLVAGVTVPWREATVGQVAAFLQRWRRSRFDLLQQGYQALARAMIACWYGNPLSWARIGYAGPPFAGQLGLE